MRLSGLLLFSTFSLFFLLGFILGSLFGLTSLILTLALRRCINLLGFQVVYCSSPSLALGVASLKDIASQALDRFGSWPWTHLSLPF